MFYTDMRPLYTDYQTNKYCYEKISASFKVIAHSCD